jgi:diacylglycerol kinase family enzyme
VRLRLIVNPIASSMNDRRLALIQATLAAGHTLEVVTTKGRDHARELARDAADAGVDVVVVAAGDGTLNEAANGLVGTATALAPIPAGSTNVFARAVGYGNRLVRATERLLVALDRGAIRRVGIGAANGRHFLFHLGAGFDAAVVARIEETPGVKRYAAHPAFALATARTLRRGFDRVSPMLRVRLPDGSQHESFFSVVSNLAPYTYFGARRMLLTRDASLDRALALTSLTRFTIADVANTFTSTVGGARRLARAPTVVQRVDLDSLRLTAIGAGAGQRFPWQVDGDYLGHVDDLDVVYVPDALSLVLPVRRGAVA